MSANPGWYADPTTTHGLRYWNGSVWTHDVVDHDVHTKSVFDAASLPAPEVTAIGPSVEPSVPTQVPVGSPPSQDMPIGVWILLVGLCLCLVATIGTANAGLMRLWFRIAAGVSVIAVIGVVILVSKLVMDDRRRAATTGTGSPTRARRFLRRRSPQDPARSLSGSSIEEPVDPTDDIRLDR